MRSSRQFLSPRQSAQLGLASAATLMLSCLTVLAYGSAADRRALAEHQRAAARQAAAASRPQAVAPAEPAAGTDAKSKNTIARPLTVAAR